LEVKGSVAVLSQDVRILEENRGKAVNPKVIQEDAVEPSESPVKDTARKAKGNLWLLTESSKSRNHRASTTSLYSRLCALRAEFDYSIVESRLAGGSCEAAALGQLTDGIVLVLAAHKTRRAAALRFKETLETARTRILGSVLCERTFPIPDAIYRRL
jgi:Mrp family chromosome partitioning ATPase